MEPEKKSNGALVGLIVIILILVMGGIYMWQVNKRAIEEKQKISEEQSAITDQDINELDTLEQNASAIDATTGVDMESVN